MAGDRLLGVSPLLAGICQIFLASSWVGYRVEEGNGGCAVKFEAGGAASPSASRQKPRETGLDSSFPANRPDLLPVGSW